MNFLNRIIYFITGSQGDGDAILQNAYGKTFYSFILQGSAVALVALSNIIIARIMGEEEYGLYTTAFTIVALLSGISTSGFVNLLVRKSSKYLAMNKEDYLKGLLNWTNKNVLIINIILILLAFFVLNLVLSFFSIVPEDQKKVILFSLIAIPILSFITINQTLLNGTHFIVESQLSEKIIKPLILILSVGIFFWITSEKMDALTAASFNLLSFIICLIITIRLVNKKVNPILENSVISSEKKLWASSYRSLFLLSGLSIINSKIDILMLFFLKDTTQVGIYNASLRISEMISFSLFVINITLAPLISKLYVKSEIKQLQKAITHTSRFVLILGICMFVIIVFAGKFLLSLFGEAFSEGYMTLIILSASQLIAISMGPAGYLLTMTGNERVAVSATVVATVINIILNLILVPPYGIVGAAYSAGISTIVWNVYMAVEAKIKTGINPTFINIKK